MTDHMVIEGDGYTTLHIEIKGDSVIFSIQKKLPAFQQKQFNTVTPITVGALAIRKVDWSDINAFVRNECERQANLKNEGIKEDGKA